MIHNIYIYPTRRHGLKLYLNGKRSVLESGESRLSVGAVLRKLRRLKERREEKRRAKLLERRRELAEAYEVRKLDALVKACEIEEKWRRRGLSLEDLLFYGEWSGLAAAEGLPAEDLFFDSRDWANLMWLANMPDDGSVSACKILLTSANCRSKKVLDAA